MSSLKVENLSLLAGEELSMLREIYDTNIGHEQQPQIMGCLITHALITLRSLGDAVAFDMSFEAMLADEAEVSEWISETF